MILPARHPRQAPRPQARPLVEAGVAVVRDGAGRVLMAERPGHQMSPWHWELPGGKIEPGETPEQAARRELFEEVGVEAESLRPFLTHEHVFPTRRVRLHIFAAGSWRGKPHGREGQRIDWIDPAAPHLAPFLASNLRPLAILGLPRLALTTDAGPEGLNAALARAAAAARRERVAILVREPRLAPGQRRAFACRLAALLKGSGSHVWIAEDAQAAVQCGAQALAAEARPAAAGAGGPAPLFVALAPKADDVAPARARGADAVVLLGEGPEPARAEADGFPVYRRGAAAGASGFAWAPLAEAA